MMCVALRLITDIMKDSKSQRMYDKQNLKSDVSNVHDYLVPLLNHGITPYSLN